MYKHSLVTIDDLSNGQIEDILDLAQEIEDRLRGGQQPDMLQAIPTGGDDEDEPEEVQSASEA